MTNSVPFLFATVGSTDFDGLVRAVDQIAPELDVADGVIQIGHGRYEPNRLAYFRFATSLAPYYEKASLVVAHGGLGTTMEVLRRGIPLVSVSNPDRYDSHQDDLLAAMADEGYLIWCRKLESLSVSIAEALSQKPKSYTLPHSQIHHKIREYLTTS